MKNYIGFVNDHSGSMGSLTRAAIADYNTNITAVKEAASREMLDTVVSVVGIGYPSGRQVTRQVMVSNPHVLKPITKWPTAGGTPLYDGIGDMIEMLSSLPDSNSPDVSFLVMVTTDGQECDSRKYNRHSIADLIQSKQSHGNWTFVFRVPASAKLLIGRLGVPLDNIQSWDTTDAGMRASTQVNTQAMDTYFSTRSAGASASKSFYSNAAAVNVSVLTEVPAKAVSLYVVDQADEGIQIRDFILKKRMEYLKGAAFYQLTKTEARVQINKQFIVRDRTSGKMYHGPEVRVMLGLPTDRNARLHPGDHANYDIFIQSESINRKLVGGTGVVYWPNLGVKFTQAELDVFAPKPTTVTAKTPKKPEVVVLPAVKPTNKPTKSPIPVTPRYTYGGSRDVMRAQAKAAGKQLMDAGKGAEKGKRWYF